MNAPWPGFIGWLLRSSWQASILIALILLAQFCLGNRLDGRWRHALWLLVLLRLALPFSPPSPASLFNYIRYAPATPSFTRLRDAPNPSATPLPAAPQILTPAAPEPKFSGQTTPLKNPALPALVSAPHHWRIPTWMEILPWIWAAGAFALFARAIIQLSLFRLALRQSQGAQDAQTLELFAACRKLMGVKTPITLVESAAVNSPALHGLFRPRLLMPSGFASYFSAAEMRHIFLHELAHARRRDMPAQWLAAFFQIIHWFNPVLWFGFRRMAADRELACDELALSVTGETQRREYGRTILKLLERFAEPGPVPGLVGILEDKTQIQRRISMIARFHRHSRWSLAGFVAMFCLGLATLTGAQTEKASVASRADLRGAVLTTNGQPIRASVFIYTAGPKTGTSPYCPSCYLDCRKSAATDASGRFTIASLNPELRFRVLVVAENFLPKFVDRVDPAAGPMEVHLEARDLANVPATKTVAGRVVDSHGDPIPEAKISATGVQYKDGARVMGDTFDGVDPVAVSGADGKFVIASRVEVVGFDLKVEARGYANRAFESLGAGAKPVDLRLTEGASIKGRVLFRGQPLPNISVGVVSEDRSAGNFSGNFEIATHEDGTFEFVNLPPNVRYQVYALMDSVKPYGASPVVLVTVGNDGTTVDAGGLIVDKANEVSGRVVLADGQPVPAKTRLMMGREDAWDSMIVDLDPDGGFDFKGVPSDTMSLTLAVNGYSLSASNKSLDKANPFELVGRVNGDIQNLTIALDKTGYHGASGDFAEEQLLGSDPLHGAEDQTATPPRADFGAELADIFKPSTEQLESQAGSSPPAFTIKVPILEGDNPRPDWDASEETRRNIITSPYATPHPSLASAADSDSPASLARSDFAKYLANPPWIKRMTFVLWRGCSSGNDAGHATAAKWLLETNLIAIQPAGYFSQELTYDPMFAWSSPGEIEAQGLSKDWYWRGGYRPKLHQIFLSPRQPDKGASPKDNPQVIAGWKMESLQQIRHLGFPALQPNSFAFHDARQFAATTAAGQTLKGTVLAADGNRPLSLIYKATNGVFRVDYRYQDKSPLPAYLEVTSLSETNSARVAHPMISIEQVEYGLDSSGTNGYEPAQFFPDMDFTHVELWQYGKRLSVAPDGRQVTINN